MRAAVASAAFLAAACNGVPSETQQCDVAAAALASTAADRKLLGAGGAYDADGALRERDAELHVSVKARRDVAWATVQKVLAPVTVAHAPPSVSDAKVPLWQTWYGKDDINRMFVELYSAIAPPDRLAHEPFTNADIDGAFGWNATAVDDLPNWDEQRWLDYLASFEDAADVAGAGGIGQVRYSPSAVRRLMQSYPQIIDCIAAGAPAPLAEGPAEAVQQLVREPVVLAACAPGTTYGPFFAASDSTMSVSFEGQGDATVEIRDDRGQVVCSDAYCDVPGPGRFYVGAVGGVAGARGVLAVDYRAPDPAWSACLGDPFALDSVVVKTAWRRVDNGDALLTYDTSAAALAGRLATGASWEQPDGEADPDADAIYTMRLPAGAEFRLAALHIMTKELDHWLWITLWWSPEPDTDFGQDRPASITGAWRNYKMCVATSFDERDPDPTGGYSDSAPSLAAALAAVHEGERAPSWCSNPYLERGDGNADTNCIGCHQHGGTGTLSELIIGEPNEFPHHGRTELRNNFPTDYSWATDAGDRLGILFTDIVDYYDSGAE